MDLIERMVIVNNFQIRFNKGVKEDVARLRMANEENCDVV